jgi:hypothetical protein
MTKNLDHIELTDISDNIIVSGRDQYGRLGVLLRVIEGLLTILHQLKTGGVLSRYEVALINGAAAIADCVRRRHVG